MPPKPIYCSACAKRLPDELGYILGPNQDVMCIECWRAMGEPNLSAPDPKQSVQTVLDRLKEDK